MTKKEREQAERKALVAAAIKRIAARLDKEAGDVELAVGGYPLDFQLTVDESTVSVGEPKTGPRGYKYSINDLLVAVLIQMDDFESFIESAFDLLIEADTDADRASELKAFAVTVKDHYEGQHDRRRRRTAARTSKPARTATVAGVTLEGRVGAAEFDISLEGDS